MERKMSQLHAEMLDLLQQDEASKQELKALFEKLGYSISLMERNGLAGNRVSLRIFNCHT